MLSTLSKYINMYIYLFTFLSIYLFIQLSIHLAKLEFFIYLDSLNLFFTQCSIISFALLSQKNQLVEAIYGNYIIIFQPTRKTTYINETNESPALKKTYASWKMVDREIRNLNESQLWYFYQVVAQNTMRTCEGK